jgi:CheY-like chemotaxis protein
MKQKKFIFVDDDPGFLSTIKELFTAMGKGSWEVFTAENHAQTLEILQQQRVEVIVLDIGMPIMDGVQFLRLINRTHPGQQVVMLTGEASEERRKVCQENGAALLLTKPITPEGFLGIFSALDALAGAHPQTGFRGTVRQVGLPEVLQMECLGHKSSVLEIFTEKVRGKIYISEGLIVHAESGALQGEAALYGLLALTGGEFNLQPFAEPAGRTIEGQWEFLLMESARLRDEGTQFFQVENPEPPAVTQSLAIAEEKEKEKTTPAASSDTELVSITFAAPSVRIQETLLCSGAGEVLYESGCENVESRAKLLEQVEQQAAQLSNIARVGRFDRLEVITNNGRIICQVQPNRRVFVRSLSPDAQAR